EEKKILNYLGHKKSDIVFLQEMHLIPGKTSFRGSWIGQAFHNAHDVKMWGVSTLFRKNFLGQFERELKDSEGRILILIMKINNTRMALANIYAPSTLDMMFFTTLQALLIEVQDIPLIVGGDFNQIIDPYLDRSRVEKLQKPPPDREALLGLISGCGLVDIWRLVHPQSLEFIFCSSPHNTRTRIDMFLISKYLVNSVKSCEIGIRALSDHAPVDLLLQWETGIPKKGRWCMNASLLQVDSYKEEIRAIVLEYLELNEGSVSISSSLWEAGKAYFRGHIIVLSSRVRRESLGKIRDLEQRIKDLESCIASPSSQGNDIQELVANLVHQQEVRKWIPAVHTADGSLLTEPKDISNACRLFYSNLYSMEGEVNEAAYRAFLGELDIPKLSRRDRELLDSPIMAAEVHSAIHEMQRGLGSGSH
uniref:exodeoxyribonuclease III n=1 Tax=Latimeria chalumnae TaxID=7897 RepID=H3AAD4_LATCH